MLPPIRCRVLGPLRVWDDAAWSPVRAAHQRLVLAVLLIEAGRMVSTDRLIDEIWGERPPRSAWNVVHGYVARLHRLLGGGTDGPLRTRDRGYELAVRDGTGGEHSPEAVARLGLANAYAELGHVDAATAHALAAVAIARRVGYRVHEGNALTTLADLALRRGRAAEALDLAGRALASHTETGHRLGEARSLLVADHACRALGRDGEARVHAERAWGPVRRDRCATGRRAGRLAARSTGRRGGGCPHPVYWGGWRRATRGVRHVRPR